MYNVGIERCAPSRMATPIARANAATATGSAKSKSRVLARTIELAIDEAEAEEPGQRRRRIEDELHRVELEIGRFTEAIGRGEPLPSILEALRDRERRRRDLREQLAQVDGLVVLAARPDELDRELHAKLDEWQGLLERQPIQARQLLRTLLAGRAESVISDRLISHLCRVGALTARSPRQNNSLHSLVSMWKKTVPEPIRDRFFDNLQAETDIWRERRNHIVHGIVKVRPGGAPPNSIVFKREAEEVAKSGHRLAKSVCNWSYRERNKRRRSALA
jgi:hypothetical protein